MTYKPLMRGREGMPDVEVSMDMYLYVPANTEDAGLEVDWAQNVIDKALDAYGGEGEAVLRALKWRKPPEYDG